MLFLRELIKTAWRTPCDRKTLLQQIYQVSVQSLVTTASAGFFVGAIMSVQFNVQLKEFGALTVLGGLATSGTIRELGPLLIAFMLSGKVGAFTSAETWHYESDRADRCHEMPWNKSHAVSYSSAFLGIIISSFFLLMAGLLMSVLGGMIVAMIVAQMNPAQYISQIPVYVTFPSVLNGLFKCLTFSALIATICTYNGYTTTGGAKGVGRTVIATALSSMVGIVLMDWVTSYLARNLALMFGGTFG